MANFVKTVVADPVHQFGFSQRELDLLISVLHDLVHDNAAIQVNRVNYRPNAQARTEMRKILDAFNEVGMSVENDYLSNFDEE